MKTTSEKMMLIHWFDEPAQAVPISADTVRWLLEQEGCWQMVEEIEVLHFVQEEDQNDAD